MRWTAAALLRPITFVLAIVAAVLVVNRTAFFWYCFLAWFIALAGGRVADAVARGRLDAFVELQLSIWDAIGGLLVVQEAGGYTAPFAPAASPANAPCPSSRPGHADSPFPFAALG